MRIIENKNIKYFVTTNLDESWGIVVTTVGCQSINPNSSYPQSQHPQAHTFKPSDGRILKEYQLIYISKGEGYFESASCKKIKVTAGTMILLFPNEWHTYEPNQDTGWHEYWVGFRGIHIDKRVDNGFFSKKNPIFDLGFSSTIIGLYEDILNYASSEKTGYQQITSSIVLYILGSVYYKNKNANFDDSFAVNKINEARTIMKKEIEIYISPETIAKDLAISYSWFRKMFKKYVGVSPSQYQAHLRYLRSLELLDTNEKSITEISDILHFENPGQFSTFFRKKEGISPSQYRREKQSIKQIIKK